MVWMRIHFTTQSPIEMNQKLVQCISKGLCKILSNNCAETIGHNNARAAGASCVLSAALWAISCCIHLQKFREIKYKNNIRNLASFHKNQENSILPSWGKVSFKENKKTPKARILNKMSKRDMVQTCGTLKSLSWEFQVCKTQSWHPLELSQRVSNTTVPGEHPDHTMENAETRAGWLSACAFELLLLCWVQAVRSLGQTVAPPEFAQHRQCTASAWQHKRFVISPSSKTWRWVLMGFTLCHLLTSFSKNAFRYPMQILLLTGAMSEMSEDILSNIKAYK